MKEWGNVRLCIFGESHGEHVGLRMQPPAGIRLDADIISRDIARRKAGGASSTPRVEADIPQYLSGVTNGITDGSPLEVIFKNEHANSAEYAEISSLPRPSHADYPAYVKLGAIPAGGGCFSGRMTLPLVFAGAVARAALSGLGVCAASHLLSVGSVRDCGFDMLNVSCAQLLSLRASDLPLLDEAVREPMLTEIAAAKASGDSVGGVVECAMTSLPVGLGGELTGGLESRIAPLVFAVPGIKALEFGGGAALASLRGSAANDCLRTDGTRVFFESNNAGGILGGMASGAPVILRAAFKPTPSIAKPQHTVDLARMQNADIAVRGRHDACIALRGLAAVEAAMLLGAWDAVLEGA